MNSESMFQSLCMYFRSDAEEVVRYWVNPLIPNELILECQDGSIRIYNDFTNTIRKIINDKNIITEEERRREFGRRLQYLISRKGYTQEEFAELLGISRAILNGYITGRSVASYTMACAMADILGCSTEDLRYR